MKKLQLDRFIFKTSKKEKANIDKQLGKCLYATNRTVGNPQFLKFAGMMRPGYKVPTRKEVYRRINFR